MKIKTSSKIILIQQKKTRTGYMWVPATRTAKGILLGYEILLEPVTTVILAAAAQKLAEAFGARLGEALGQKFADAVLGTSNDSSAFNREVISRLARIEQKLDEVISFIRTQLPDLIKEAVTTALIEQGRYELNARINTLAASIATLDKNDSLKNADDVAVRAESVFNQTDMLTQYGVAFYPVMMTGWGAYLSAAARVLEHLPDHGATVSARASVLKARLSEWCSTLESRVAAFQSDYDTAKVNAFTLQLSHFILVINGPIEIARKGPNGEKIYRWDAFNAYALGPEGRDEIGWLPQKAHVYWPPLGDPTPPPLTVFGESIRSWWHDGQPPNYSNNYQLAEAYYREFVSLVQSWHSAIDLNPAKIQTINYTLPILHAIQASLSQIPNESFSLAAKRGKKMPFKRSIQ